MLALAAPCDAAELLITAPVLALVGSRLRQPRKHAPAGHVANVPNTFKGRREARQTMRTRTGRTTRPLGRARSTSPEARRPTSLAPENKRKYDAAAALRVRACRYQRPDPVFYDPSAGPSPSRERFQGNDEETSRRWIRSVPRRVGAVYCPVLRTPLSSPAPGRKDSL
ncbi:hypothetical protein CC85DRAFT_99759 [Cutaneotrichosporon oleaginosum]|uniref:Uncharacterized protein n=1 Tax=Cutaneotrichosporon oleaginosum TaxID=879819 RepID=A0A0J0XM40_9TREE|nr:uncharacterized protein CC85DRAFT_99759 [Cutaneotrichosporon oleaginosum]KLT42128.1 hypothetical protein CC85DRAFT_99759 [Cutaneotrichosporon oleaginosum]TXT04633.1 hypothetical protein COLE_07452 [Cutaneotrichosporon oleaginosum]